MSILEVLLTPKSPAGRRLRKRPIILGLLLTCGITSLTGAQNATSQPSPLSAGKQGKSQEHLTAAVLAATVNDVPITQTDLDYRLKFVLVTSGMTPTEPEVAALRKRILDKMVEEKLQILEAKKHGLTPTPEDVTKAVHTIEQREGMSLGSLYKAAKDHNLPESTVEDQVRASMVWRELVQQLLGKERLVSDAEIDAHIRQSKELASSTSITASEIFLPTSTTSQEAQVRMEAEKTVAQLRKGANFSELARVLSKSATAARGGLIGPVSKGMLDAPLEKVLFTLKDNDVSDPIQGRGGFYILKKHPLDNVTYTMLQISLPVHSQEQVERAAAYIDTLRGKKMSCENRQKMIQKNAKGVTVSMNKDVPPHSLHPELLKLLTPLKPDEISPPIFAGNAMLSMAICHIDEKKNKIPTREEAFTQLTEETMALLAQRFMRDLKRSADIHIY